MLAKERATVNKEIFTSPILSEQYKKYTHPSGLEIYIFSKELTTFYAIFGVKYGSIHSSFSKSSDPSKKITVPDGIAHFLEHKLFTNEDGSDSFEHFSALGADANAYTEFNKTAYLFSATESFYESLAELVKFVTHPYFTKESVSSEIGIIAEEIKMYDDSPPDRCFYGMLEGMYEHHSIRRNICGTEKTIKQITPELLYECYGAFYKPCNMALFICGNVDEDKVIEVLDPLLPNEGSELDVIFENENAREKPTAYMPYVESRMQVSKPIFNIGIKDVDIPESAGERQKKDAIYSILNEMIFSRAGELYSDLLERDIISPHLSYGYTISPTTAYNSIAGEANDPRLALEEILKYVEALDKNGLSHSDFLRGKRVMYAEFVKSFDSSEGIANNLLSFSFDGAELLSYADIIESVTFEDVNEAFKEAFNKEKITLSVILPIESKEEI